MRRITWGKAYLGFGGQEVSVFRDDVWDLKDEKVPAVGRKL